MKLYFYIKNRKFKNYKILIFKYGYIKQSKILNNEFHKKYKIIKMLPLIYFINI